MTVTEASDVFAFRPADAKASVTTIPTTNAECVVRWGLQERPVEIKGRGVFPACSIPKGGYVIKFEGPVFDRGSCPDFSEAIQVGVDSWMWSSGGLDDLVRGYRVFSLPAHSTDPDVPR